jgi:hypothetical protein
VAQGFAPAEKDLHFDEGARKQVALELTRTSPAPEAAASDKKTTGSRTPGIVVTTLGGAGLLVGGIFGGLAFSATNSAKSQCSSDLCPVSSSAEISRSKTYGNVSTAAFIGGGALAVTGIVLLVVAPGGGAKPSDEAGPSARLSPWIGPSGAGLGATGSF